MTIDSSHVVLMKILQTMQKCKNLQYISHNLKIEHSIIYSLMFDLSDGLFWQ